MKLKLFAFFLSLAPIIPIIVLIIYLNRFVGIDETLRLYISLCLIFIYLLTVALWLYFSVGRNKIGRFIMTVMSAFLLGGSGYFAYANISVYNSLNRMAINQHVTNFSLVTMANSEIETVDDLQGKVIGLLHLSDPGIMSSIEETLAENDLNTVNEMVEYNSPLELIQDLYMGEIDVMIIGSNFISIFSEQEQFRDIETDTRILKTFSIIREIAIDVNADASLTEDSFTVLLLGTNSMLEGNIDAGQVNILMLMTVNLQNLSVTLTSVPRDSYVFVPCLGMYDKLSHSHVGGTPCVIDTVENLFDMEIPHHVKINFRGMVELVDTLGGITVDVPVTFTEQNSWRQFGEHMITVEKGLQTLNGEEALALARHRKSLPTGSDLDRIPHQQLILEALIRELSEEVETINELVSLINVLGHNVETSFSINDMTSVAQYLLELLPTFGGGNPLDYIHMMNMVLNGQFGEKMTIWESFPLSMFFPYQESIAEARTLMQINLGERDPEFKFAFAFDGFATDHRTQWLSAHDPGIWFPPVEYYPPPVDGYPPPASEWTPPPSEWTPPPSEWTPPPVEGYPPPVEGYPPPVDGYPPPPIEYPEEPETTD